MGLSVLINETWYKTDSPAITDGSVIDHLAGLKDEQFGRVIGAAHSLRGLPPEEQERAANRVAEAAEALKATAAEEIAPSKIEAALVELKAGRTELAEKLFTEIQDEKERAGKDSFAEAAEAARHRAAFIYLNNKAKAMEALRDAVRLDATNMRAWIDLGDVAAAAGRLDDAAEAYMRFRDLAEKVQDERAKSVSFNKIADVLRAQGKLDEALGHYRDGLAIAERLAKADATNTEWQRDLSVNFNQIANVLSAQGKLDEALAYYHNDLAIAERLAKADPSNTDWQRDLSVSFEKIGDVLRAQGKLDEALSRYRDDLAIVERLAEADPSNTEWQRDLSVSFNRVADVLSAQGKLEEARSYVEKDLDIARRLSAADPSNAEWQVDLAISCSSLAGFGEDDAIDLRSEAVAILETLDKNGLLAPEHKDFLAGLKDLVAGATPTDAT